MVSVATQNPRKGSRSLNIGTVVEVAFKQLPQDEVDIPPELSDVLQTKRKAREV